MGYFLSDKQEVKSGALKIKKFIRCCNYIHNIIIKKYKNRSLQALASAYRQMRKRASDFASCQSTTGSATVESVLALPVFLCAMVSVLMMGQSIVTEGKIQHAVTKTAKLCASQKAMNKEPNVFRTFYSVFEMSQGDSSCIAGNKAGIRLSIKEHENGELIEVKAVYRLRITTSFLGELSSNQTATAVQRVFCGYSSHGEPDNDKNPIVYVAKTGNVYHTNLSCSHICISISGEAVEQLMNHSGLDACEKCIQKGEKPSKLYITAYGECFHSSLHCSGLKRSVKAIRLSEAGHMRMCTRCAARAAAGD